MIKIITTAVKAHPKYFLFLIIGLIVAIIGSYFLIKIQFQQIKRVETTDALIEKTQSAINFDKKDTNAIVTLASLYFQKSRETADTSYYKEIENLFDKHKDSLQGNFAIPYLLSQIANARHDFILGEKLSTDSIKLAPNSSKVYGPLVDALVEQGKYKEAESTLQKMVNLRPDFASLTRVAYFREIHGDIAGAIDSLNQAQSAGATFAENRAWLLSELGKLYFRSDLTKAEERFKLALEVEPNYAPAFEWLARIEYARDNKAKALEYIDKALEILPIAQYSTLKYKVATESGDKATATQMSILTQLTYENSQKAGTNVDMELAYFLADNDIDNKKALELAIKAYQVRKSIYGADTLALAYYKNSDYAEALKYIREALRLGENDAQIVLHASNIYRALNNKPESDRLRQKATALNPNLKI